MDRQTRLLPLIAAFKICKACLLFGVAFGLHKLWHGDAQQMILGWMHAVKIDPENKIVHGIASKITGLPPSRLHELGVGTFFYGLMFGTEGVGLLLKQRWAEYMTVLTTMTFLPLEVYELVAKPEHRAVKAVVLLLNVAILVYLLWNLIKARKAENAGRGFPVIKAEIEPQG
jgi:uncharacterized membrane protein (DUF2068 family)